MWFGLCWVEFRSPNLIFPYRRGLVEKVRFTRFLKKFFASYRSQVYNSVFKMSYFFDDFLSFFRPVQTHIKTLKIIYYVFLCDNLNVASELIPPAWRTWDVIIFCLIKVKPNTIFFCKDSENIFLSHEKDSQHSFSLHFLITMLHAFLIFHLVVACSVCLFLLDLVTCEVQRKN